MAKGFSKHWPEEVMAYHRRLYDSLPPMSHSKIAKEVNERFGHLGRPMTRNASIGLAYRNGYPGRPPSIPYFRSFRKPTKRRKPVKPRVVKEPEPVPMNVTVLQLRDYQTCKWPVGGEGAHTLFCGVKPALGSSYCPHHKARSVQSVTPRKRKQFSKYGNWLSQRIITAGG